MTTRAAQARSTTTSCRGLSTVGGGARTLPDDFTKTIGCDVTKGWCAPSIACPTVWCETVMGCAG